MNIVVGRPGMTIPTSPKPVNMIPAEKYAIFITRLVFLYAVFSSENQFNNIYKLLYLKAITPPTYSSNCILYVVWLTDS